MYYWHHGNSHVENSKVLDPWDVGKAISPYGPCSRGMVQLPWVSEQECLWMVAQCCARTSTCSFLLLRLLLAKTAYPGKLASPYIAPSEHAESLHCVGSRTLLDPSFIAHVFPFFILLPPHSWFQGLSCMVGARNSLRLRL